MLLTSSLPSGKPQGNQASDRKAGEQKEDLGHGATPSRSCWNGLTPLMIAWMCWNP